MAEMKAFESGAIREDKTGKGRMDLMPWGALIRLSKHYEKGGRDHGDHNWKKGIPIHSFLDSALRHLAKYMEGFNDEDHLAAAAWNILGAMWTEEHNESMQDIPSRSHGTVLPLASDSEARTAILPETEGQENVREKLGEVCDCWESGHDLYGAVYGTCNGTKDKDPCTCNGDPAKCDFYPEKRKRALNAK